MGDLGGSLSVHGSSFIKIPNDLNPFPSLLSEFIYVRTYSRWVDEIGRRETWTETVDRYINYLAAERPSIPRHVLEETREAILALKVLPSMRALWSAGDAARRDNTSMYNCFSGSEKFLTPEGSVSFADTVGKTVVVRTADGAWRPATVVHFGRQATFDIMLAHWTGGKHGNEKQTIRVTANHRWLLSDGTETTNLKVGDKLASPNLALNDDLVDEDAVRHGFVFGDGTISRSEGRDRVQVRLCGKKTRLARTLFRGYSSDSPPSYGDDLVVYLGEKHTAWKQLPLTTDPRYVAGFIHGLFLADGCGVGTSGNLRFISQDESLVAWMREHAPLAGYKFLSDQVYEEPTKYGERGVPLHMFLLGTGNTATLQVESIVSAGTMDVYCVVEPVTRTFTLACGQVTGNCSFIPLDSIPSFAEALHILMCGTGVGFSVERQFVNNLPVVGALTSEVIPYKIADSTEGWAEALRFGLMQWFRGNQVAFDYSGLRPRGAPLKTKGGRASGPEPLQRLLDLCQEVILGATGRKLRPIECHDIACAIGDIVHVGGFRRAALISFSDPDDEEMRHAKDWSRGDFPAIRYMSNNSAFYAERPDETTFWNEWRALVASRSGERGFFRMPPAKRATRRGDYRTNPCVSGRTWVQTTEGPRQVFELIGKPFTTVVDGREYPSTEMGFWKTDTKPLYRLNTVEGYNLELTEDHQVCRVVQTARAQRCEWVPAKDLRAGDLIRLNNHRGVTVPRTIETERGWLLGSLLGDGTFNRRDGKSDQGQLRFWGEGAEEMARATLARIQAAGLTARSDFGVTHHKAANTWQVTSVALAEFAKLYGVVPAAKTITPAMEREDDSFVAGLLSGLFDADGCVVGCQDKGVSVRLSQSNRETLEAVQRMLLRLGVVSSIYKNRREAGYRDLPDGKGGVGSYWCEAQHELSIASDNLFRFEEVVGFTDPEKVTKLDALLSGYRRQPNRERFVARFAKGLVTPIGEEDVYDCSIPGLNAFDANGLYVHNCGEIGLRYTTSVDPWTGEGGSGSFCNLTAAVMRADDTKETMAEKVRIATWLGVIQATFTDFPYLRKGWTKICDEDRLLGVDITGQCDNPGLSDNIETMTYFNQVARETAAEAAAMMGINMPAAITCGKPSGNSSQLVDCSSGFHPRYARYYFRRVRIDGKDPLTALLRDAGVPMYKENGMGHLPDADVPVWVVEFPVKAPANAMVRDSETAVEMCDRYLRVMRSWCGERGHNQSATIYVRDHEWEDVGRWVWEHFDEITGLAFLPHDGGLYKLAPYEEITEAQYNAAMATMPVVDFSLLTVYEHDDRGKGSTELACMSGSCEL